MRESLQNFPLLRDFVDQGARPQQAGSKAASVWTVGQVVVAGAASFAADFTKLTNSLLGVAGRLVPLLLSIVFFGVAVWVVVAKQVSARTEKGSQDDDSPSLTERFYSYSVVVRNTAKLALLPLAAIVLFNAESFRRDAQPLPRVFAGELKHYESGAPLAGARVGILARERDVTGVELISNRRGVYWVETAERTSRSAKLSVRWPQCPDGVELPLYRPYQSKQTGAVDGILFSHRVRCFG